MGRLFQNLLGLEFGDELDKIKSELQQPKYIKKDISLIDKKFIRTCGSASGDGANRLINHLINLNKGVIFLHLPPKGKPFLKNEITGHIYKTIWTRNQYPCWSVASKAIAVHRLIGWVLLSNSDPNKYTHVDHIDGTKNNYDVDNLEWVTNGENIKRQIKTKANKKPKVGQGILWKKA